MTSGERMPVDLTDLERRLLLAGLMDYGGAAAGARALVLTEVCWASDIRGAASDFGTNLPVELALVTLRSLQRKLVTGARVDALIGLSTTSDESLR